jgi:hypothetical protein
MTVTAPLAASSAAQTLVTTNGLELNYTVLARRGGLRAEAATPVIWIEGFGGTWCNFFIMMLINAQLNPTTKTVVYLAKTRKYPKVREKSQLRLILLVRF